MKHPGEGSYLDELKYTDHKSFSLAVAKWLRHRHRAHSQGREPRMILDFPAHRVRLVVTEEPYPKEGV